MAFTLPDDRTASGSVTITDAAGFPAAIDGVPTWESSDPSIVTVVASDDGRSVSIAPASPVKLGSAQVKFTADADLGAGVIPVIAIGDVEVVAGTAVAANLSFSLVEPTPPPVPPTEPPVV